MKLLVDTHLLLWSTVEPYKLSRDARRLLEDIGNTLLFSAASIWEIVIKRSKGHVDFQVDAVAVRSRLLQIGYEELSVQSEHALAVATLPPLHKDPFDRILVGQAIVESLTLLTGDTKLAGYPGPIFRV
jgi:PIN domain nuclease of toxin-antitoxin system